MSTSGAWRRVALVLVALHVAACSTVHHAPTTPRPGQSAGEVDRDRRECDARARAAAPSRLRALGGWVGGKVVGTLVGAAVGGFTGVMAAAERPSLDGDDALAAIAGAAIIGAAVGFVLGGWAGLQTSVEARDRAIVSEFRQCMRERGYQIQL